MTYFRDVYKKRGQWWGETSSEQYLNISKKYFEDYLLNSPDAGAIILNNDEVIAAIRDNKQDENELSKFFLIDIETNVSQGDLITWYGDEWLVIRKEKRNFEAYNKVLTFRCNYNLTWIDEYGVFNSTPSYLFGGMSSKVQDNFRMSNGLVIPQSNKYLEIILPDYPIKSEQRFIIRNEAWRVIERDLVSVDGILYMSLIEDLVDSYDDSKLLGLADYGKLGIGYIDIGLTGLTLGIGDSFTFNPVLYKENKVVPDATFIYSSNEEDYYITLNSNTVTGLDLGTATLYVSSVDQPDLQTTCIINVLAASVEKDVLQIVGDNTIKNGRTRTYTTFYNTGGTPQEIAATFTILNNTGPLVTLSATSTTTCSLVANTDGLTGTITLRATTAEGVINKTISVVSVW